MMMHVLNFLATACVAGVLAELLARFWIRHDRRYFVFAPRSRQELTLDQATHPQLAPHVTFAVNRDGERGDDFGSRPGTFRVLVAGGSCAECFFLDQTDAWPFLVQSQLSSEEALAALGKRHIHVGSIARSGIHSGSMQFMLERTLPRYENLDLIVLMVGAGDALRWLIEGLPGDGALRITAEDCFSWCPETPLRLTLRRCGLAEVVRRGRDWWFPRVERRDHVGRWVGRARAMRAAAIELREELPDPSGLLAAYEKHLRGAIGVARTNSREVLVIRQPWFDKDAYGPDELALFWNGGLGDSFSGPVTTFYSPVALSRLMRLIDDRTQEVAGDCGVACMELRSAVGSSTANYYDQFHFTMAGSRAAADAVTERILQLMKPESHAPVRLPSRTLVDDDRTEQVR